MKFLIALLVLAFGVLALTIDFTSDHFREPAQQCRSTSNCSLPECHCTSTKIPGGLNANNTPQIVMLSFSDEITISNIDFFREAFVGRINPNNCTISATFFVSHRYNNYAFTHELHSLGHEIALRSISNNPLVAYWKNATEDMLTREFADQRRTLNAFAKVPMGDIKGIRMPMFQMAGNNQMQMLTNNNFTYDMSRTELYYREPGLWPYTNKYLPFADCNVPPCHDESFPKIWSIPLLHWQNDAEDSTCGTVDTCQNMNINSVNTTSKWMIREFLKQYNGNRAPISVSLETSWFILDRENFYQYKLFLDYLGTLNDVYILSASQVIDYMRYPKTKFEMREFPCRNTYPPSCIPRFCTYRANGTEIGFSGCQETCPNNYPWLGNPIGA